MPTPKRGSVFILVLGLMVIAIALAYALVVSMRNRQEGGVDDGVNLLARQAAQAGASHALEVIERSFLSGGRRPGSLGSNWRAAFAAIDSNLAGKDQATVSADRPQGEEFSIYDANDNDVKGENLLTDPYFYLGINADNGYASAKHRVKPFATGSTWLTGTARWIEPGYYHTDLANKPVSFHLTHPQVAVPTSNDPAERQGEPWTPDINEPIWYDRHLVPTTDAARVRYRLRYAVEIEALDGKMLSSCQAPWQAPTRTSPTGVPLRSDAEDAAEVDVALTAKYSDAYSNVVMQLKVMSSIQNIHDGMSNLAGILAWRGRGMYLAGGDQGAACRSTPVLSSFTNNSANAARYWSDSDENAATPAGEPDRRIDQETTYVGGPDRLSASANGVRYTFSDGQRVGIDQWLETQFALTPFGRATRQTTSPTRWDEGYTDCPWRINLTTATARTISSMVFAYLPQEAHALLYDQRREHNWLSRDPTTGNDNYGAETKTSILEQYHPPHIDLFTAPSPLATPFSGVTPYPGIATTWTGAPIPHSALGPQPPGGTYNAATWNEFLGKTNQTNDWATKLGHTNSIDGMTVTPLQGACLARFMPWYMSSLERERTRGPGGKLIYVDALWANMGGFATPCWNANYWYTDSYWLDIASALFQTVQLAQRAHLHLDGRQRIGNAAAGIPTWPVGSGDPDLGAVAGQPMLDTDLDGDGVNDSPSLINSLPEIDRWFIKFLGENPDSPGISSTYTTMYWGFRYALAGWGQVAEPYSINAASPHHSIRAQLNAGLISVAQAKLMELAVNDFRLSFFGASPQYPNFAGLDFDGDGSATCSGYSGGSGSGVVPVANRFSLTGYFVLQQPRFFRIVVRGEVQDMLRGGQVAEANLETVYVCDPDGAVYNVQGDPTGSTDLSASRVLAQRWLWNKHQALRQRSYP